MEGMGLARTCHRADCPEICGWVEACVIPGKDGGQVCLTGVGGKYTSVADLESLTRDVINWTRVCYKVCVCVCGRKAIHLQLWYNLDELWQLSSHHERGRKA